jgi:hypothetical protein
MTRRSIRKLPSPGIAVILSIFLCGLGQIYMGRMLRGMILLLTFLCAIGIIWFGMHGTEVKIFGWGDNQLIFNPSRSVSFRGQIYYVADIMKVTGTIQLVFAWIFGVIDARHHRRGI